MSEIEFEGKVAVITGAASGIGLATARLLQARGATVMLVDRDEGGLQRAAGELDASLSSVLALDVSRAGDNERMAEVAEERHGGIDIGILNVGMPGPMGPITALDPGDFERVLAVNVTGTWLGLRSLIPALERRGGGSFVLTASTAGLRAGAPGRSPYVTSKHAVIGLMRAAAAECAPLGIRVNSVSPGAVDTPMSQGFIETMSEEAAAAFKAQFESTIPLGRMAGPDEVAEAIVFLAGERARYCTAANLVVDGGLLG
jgi:NAD(P)-dependent dehydrogenase (short-subunit alcohol dehydrogenase family)